MIREIFSLNVCNSVKLMYFRRARSTDFHGWASKIESVSRWADTVTHPRLKLLTMLKQLLTLITNNPHRTKRQKHLTWKAKSASILASCFCFHLGLWCWDELLNNLTDFFAPRHLIWSRHFQVSHRLSSCLLRYFHFRSWHTSSTHEALYIFADFIPAFLLSPAWWAQARISFSPAFLGTLMGRNHSTELVEAEIFGQLSI